ncbi:MAG: hypothetical protein AAF349_26970 [Cyanobacteria bacterium P01_A01_bin.68]
MSCVFEGILTKASSEKVKYNVNQKISTNLKLKFEKLNDYLSCFNVVENSRNFSSDLDSVASQISEIFSQAILIRYDDRIGYRESIIFEKGVPVKQFNLADEIWVMLDEDGNPILDSQQFTIDQIEEDDEEYETIYNAIQLGIEFVGINKNVWKEVHSFITKPRWRNIDF